jgi:hypothetical protein
MAVMWLVLQFSAIHVLAGRVEEDAPAKRCLQLTYSCHQISKRKLLARLILFLRRKNCRPV